MSLQKSNIPTNTLISEDFESGATGWTHYDSSVSPNNWHIYNLFGGTQGNVWWMGDPAAGRGTNIGGYYNHQYLVLNAARTLTATNATLTFKMRHNVEDPAGATVASSVYFAEMRTPGCHRSRLNYYSHKMKIFREEK